MKSEVIKKFSPVPNGACPYPVVSLTKKPHSWWCGKPSAKGGYCRDHEMQVTRLPKLKEPIQPEGLDFSR